ncbi:MAG TPA: endonuclease/exonuclease/phosphatase family protein, partial [Planctomycetota bacterium]|nr:endonuclease/exonuclease/phosphatase family protein [Planctomycetota bacterium]
MRYGLWSVVCLLVSVPLAIGLLRRRSARPPIEVVRFATFDTGLSRGGPGQLLRELQSAAATATAIAEIVQRNDVDVLLVSGLDVDEAAATVAVLRDDYLGKAQGNLTPIRFEYTFTGAVNCVPSGVDLDHDGKTDGPGDAFAAGAFAGQHGMALLSRYPILLDRVRTLQQLPWAAMPMALRPDGCSDAAWAQLRLSATSHWDVP